MNNITFIGTGAWASALASNLTKNNVAVKMWGIDQQEIDDINQGINSKYFNDQKFFNPSLVSATNNLDEALKNVDLIVLAVPSHVLVSVIEQIKASIGTKKINVINVAKGIDSTTHKSFSTIIKDAFGGNLNNLATIIGPSFASEVFVQALTMVNVVGKNSEFLNNVAQLFNNDTFNLKPNLNEEGCELFAALKNVLAIGLGIIDVLQPYRNTHAALLTLGMREINKINRFINPHSDEFLVLELAAMGDVFLTCSSNKSRNFTFGQEIAQKGIEKALNENNKTVEGYHNAMVLDSILAKHPNINVSFLKNIIKVLKNELEPQAILNFIK